MGDGSICGRISAWEPVVRFMLRYGGTSQRIDGVEAAERVKASDVGTWVRLEHRGAVSASGQR